MRRGLCLLLAVALALAAAGCGDRTPQEGTAYAIYYLNQEGSAHGGDMICSRQEWLDVDEAAPLAERAAAVTRQLMAGPTEGVLRSPFPENVSLRSLEIRGQWAYVDFSAEFNQLSGVELTLANYCLTLSLSALEGVDAVSVTAQGRTVVQQPKSIFFERDLLLSTMDDVLQTVEVTLYFLSDEGQLTGERRTLEVYEGQTLSENLVTALLEGPESRELQRVIPPGFVVNAIRVDGGICYMNLSSESLLLLPEDEDAQRLILQSLARSLYSVRTIRGLRLLADGKELTKFGVIPVEEVARRG